MRYTALAALLLFGALLTTSAGEWWQARDGSWAYCGFGQYLPAVINLEDALSKAASKDERDGVIQFLGTFLAFVGREDRTMALYDQRAPSSPLPPAAYPWPDEWQAEDAVEAILRESKGRQIVILNEAHHVPLCRRFAQRLLPGLRAEGFEYFAAETFLPWCADSWEAGYPKLTTGYYSVEPEFGHLVRTAIRLGFKGVDYEKANYPYSLGDREEQEADNLIRHVLRDNPQARIFIYCGYSHLDEAENGWMASRLKQKTGIDPLTIDQTEMLPHSAPEFEGPEYRAVADMLERPTVFKSATGSYAPFPGYPGLMDMQVFHPRSGTVEGRPAWKVADGWKPYRVAPELLPRDQRVLVQAFVASEPTDSVPMDQYLLEAGETMPALILPPGDYRLVLQDSTGKSTEIDTFYQE